MGKPQMLSQPENNLTGKSYLVVNFITNGSENTVTQQIIGYYRSHFTPWSNNNNKSHRISVEHPTFRRRMLDGEPSKTAWFIVSFGIKNFRLLIVVIIDARLFHFSSTVFPTAIFNLFLGTKLKAISISGRQPKTAKRILV